MPAYQAESFYRAQIRGSFLSTTACPITVTVSKLPTLSTGLVTISPNTEYEEIFEYNNPQSGTMTITLIKRGIKPSSILLTTNGVDYNNTTYQKDHSQNDIIRGDVNHIHINQSIGNTTLATNTGVGISKLSVAAADPADPIVVGINDPILTTKATNSVYGQVKLSVAAASPTVPIAVGDNDPRLSRKVWSYTWFITSGATLDNTFRDIAIFGTSGVYEAATTGTVVTGLGSMTGTLSANATSSPPIVIAGGERCRISYEAAVSTNQLRIQRSGGFAKVLAGESNFDLSDTTRYMTFMNASSSPMTLTFQVADGNFGFFRSGLLVEVF